MTQGHRGPLHRPQDTPKLHFVPLFFNPFKTDVHFNLGFLGRKLLYEPYGTTTDPVLSYVRFCFSNENINNMKEEEEDVIIKKLPCLSFFFLTDI